VPYSGLSRMDEVMNMNKKDLHGFRVCLVLVLLVAFMFLLMPAVQSKEPTPSEEALAILQNVIGVDLAKYNITLTSYCTEYPSELGVYPKLGLNTLLNLKKAKWMY